MTRGIRVQRVGAVGAVVAASGVVVERVGSTGNVIGAAGVVKQRRQAIGDVAEPVVFESSAWAPLATFLVPSVLLVSA